MLLDKLRKILAIFAAGVAIIAVNNEAIGTDGSTIVNNLTKPVNPTTNINVNLTSPYAYVNSSSFNSSLVVGHETFRQSAMLITNTIANRLDNLHDAASGRSSNVDAGTATLGDTGKNAGARDSRFTTWAQIGSRNFGQSQEQYDFNAKLYQFVVGSDYHFHENFLAGLAINCDYMDVKTAFNQGSSKSYAFGLKPYVLAIINKNFAVEGMVSYDRVSRKDTRKNLKRGIDAATALETAAPMNAIDSKPKSDRLVASIFARLAHKVNKVNLGLRVGYVYGQDKYKAFKETGTGALDYKGYNFKMQTLATKFSIGYSISQYLTPYVHLDYAYDLKRINNITFNNPAQGANASKWDTIKDQKVNRNAFGGGIGLKAVANECFAADVGFAYEKKGDVTGNTTQLRFNYKF